MSEELWEGESDTFFQGNGIYNPMAGDYQDEAFFSLKADQEYSNIWVPRSCGIEVAQASPYRPRDTDFDLSIRL